MEFELRAAKAKLEREQKERKDKARLKLERERKSKHEAIKQREAIEAAQRIRRLDVAQAKLKADQMTEESLLSGKGVMFHHILEAVPYQGSGDKIKLPSSCFTELSDQGALDKGPMYFRLSKCPLHMEASGLENGGVTHSGVLEFTAPEGFVEVPPHVWSNLFPATPSSAPLIEVRYVRLPKGVYAKLQPAERGFSDIPNHKAVLETCLRQHATLSQGEVVTVNHGELTFKLQVLELKPSSSVSVLETDIEVDIVGSNSTSERTDQHVLLQLDLGKTESGYVEEGKYAYYKFSIDNDVSDIVASEEATIMVKLETDNDGGDTDLYVSKHPIMFPNQHQHEWSSHDVGSKVLIIGSKDSSIPAGVYSIGVFGFKGTTNFKISVAIQDNSNRSLGERAASSSSTVDANSVECRNCHHYIPSKTIALHEAYCARHNVQCQHAGCGVVLRREEADNHIHCEKCGKAFQQREIAKHMKVFHEPLHCSCGVILEKEAMVLHQSSVCPLRLVTCRFCGDMVQAGNSANDARDRLRGFSEHESVCGSRTTPCDSCGRSVMLKEMDIHQVAVHQKS
ncbi:Ubiquitin fusion degradation protein 1-like protein [Thalictrum thalictroides]|uniref:Ubiquitin fusion degradation protein 1-like protein n=1 Tax=Thalictrum thalictroides TaxID=46969 RepID=A0A7J6V262_THATH|nr:Ubiquitin fusion degradation protein 1-like protein [Thalictrum thalictroides]